MKVGQVPPSTAHSIEINKLNQQELLKQQQLKELEENQKQVERVRPQDPGKGQTIDKMV